MPPPCSRCASQRVISLESTRKWGAAAGALAGSLKGAYAALYTPRMLSIASAPFPMGRIASAVVAATTGGIAGATAGQHIVQALLPSGSGTPWLCLGCGHAFRTLN